MSEPLIPFRADFNPGTPVIDLTAMQVSPPAPAVGASTASAPVAGKLAMNSNLTLFGLAVAALAVVMLGSPRK